jgi:hypothetical protein
VIAHNAWNVIILQKTSMQTNQQELLPCSSTMNCNTHNPCSLLMHHLKLACSHHCMQATVCAAPSSAGCQCASNMLVASTLKPPAVLAACGQGLGTSMRTGTSSHSAPCRCLAGCQRLDASSIVPVHVAPAIAT